MYRASSSLQRFSPLALLTLIVALVAATGAPARAAGYAASPLVQVSASSPYNLGCVQPQTGTNFPGTEIEPWVDVNPTNTKIFAGAWQQDRWSNGGANGLGNGVSKNGGTTWKTIASPAFTLCSGGSGLTGGYQRASDPWVSYAPDGTLHQISLSINDSDFTSAVIVSKSSNNGTTWSAPTVLLRNTEPTLFNDKESLTADPTNANYVYAIWDRLEIASGNASVRASEHAVGYRGPTFFARSTDGGNSWEAARIIYDPGEINQTIGNQIEVITAGPHAGRLVNAFVLIYNFKNRDDLRGYNVAVQYSDDKGSSWSAPSIIQNYVPGEVSDPATGAPVRTGDIIPDLAVGPSGEVYVVWQPRNANGVASVAISRSSDGGASWSAPATINAVQAVHAFTPSVEVAADGTVGVTFYDFRNNTPNPNALETDYWLAHSHDGGATWAETRITPTSFDMDNAPVARGYFVGDYEGLVTVGNSFKVFFVAATATDNDTNVYFSSVGP